jgi:hypothetical protein
MALSEAVAAGRVKKGDRLLFVAFGSGLTSGAITLEWTADPAASSRAAGIGPEDVTVMPGYLGPVNRFPPALEWLRRDAAASSGHNPGLDVRDVKPAAKGPPAAASRPG